MRTLPATIPAPSLLDRAIMAVTPEYGARRYRSRIAETLDPNKTAPRQRPDDQQKPAPGGAKGE